MGDHVYKSISDTARVTGRSGTGLGTIAWVSARISAQALEFGVWLFLARRLGAADVGVLAVVMVVLRLGGLLGDWGAAFRGAREVASHGAASALVVGLIRRRERVSILLGFAWVVGALVLRPELAPMGMVIVARGSSRDWMALGQDRRVVSVVPPLTQGGLLLVGGLMATSVGSAALAFALAYGVGWFMSLGINRLPTGTERRSAGRVDPWYLLAGLADQVLISGDIVVLAALRTAGEAGVYSIVYRYPAAWLAVVGLTISAAVPAAARGAQRRALSKADVSRAVHRGVLGAVTLLALTPLVVVSVGLLFGTEFESGRVALVILLMAGAVTTVSAPIRLLHLAYGRDRDIALVTSAVASANLVANLATVAAWGITAAAVTTLHR